MLCKYKTWKIDPTAPILERTQYYLAHSFTQLNEIAPISIGNNVNIVDNLKVIQIKMECHRLLLIQF